MRIDAQLPGPELNGSFRDEQGRRVTKVHQLATVGEGQRQAMLLMGLRNGVPCIGAAGANGRDGELDCLEPWEHPPLVVRVVAGGDTADSTDWLAVIGLTQAPTGEVVLDMQTKRGSALPLRALPGLPWRAFVAMTEKGDLANILTARDRDGAAVVSVELSWSYGPACREDGDDDACGEAPSNAPWSDARDPIADASGAGKRDHQIAFSHPSVRRLAAGKTFFINPTAGWDRCDGRPLGSVISFRLWPSVTFSGELPIHEYAREDEDVAYREGRAYVDAEQVTAVEVWVDHERERVVGVDLAAFDATELEADEPSARIHEFDVLDEPEPAGGPDDAEACPRHEPGD
jgi:hypothetical protein